MNEHRQPEKKMWLVAGVGREDVSDGRTISLTPLTDFPDPRRWWIELVDLAGFSRIALILDGDVHALPCMSASGEAWAS